MSKAKKLTRAEKQQINAAIQNARRQDKRHKSAQDSIPFQRMFPDGICRVTDHYYTKTVQFQDINYQLNQNEDKAAIFDGWCDFLNYFDSSVRFELSFINTAANKDTLRSGQSCWAQSVCPITPSKPMRARMLSPISSSCRSGTAPSRLNRTGYIWGGMRTALPSTATLWSTRR